MIDLPPHVTSTYAAMRTLPDGRIVGVKALLFHWTMHVGIDPDGYRERYCFADERLARAAMESWSGTGDPDFWHKHPETGRRRDPRTGEIWHESEIGPAKREVTR